VGVIDHQHIPADAQKRAADPARKPRAAFGIIDLNLRILIVAEDSPKAADKMATVSVDPLD
jgi:hypothetical protein